MSLSINTNCDQKCQVIFGPSVYTIKGVERTKTCDYNLKGLEGKEDSLKSIRLICEFELDSRLWVILFKTPNIVWKLLIIKAFITPNLLSFLLSSPIYRVVFCVCKTMVKV